ncbi:MAG: LysM peptidoglycan-binding domain-containing protein [Chloroflexota bacterium]
MPKTRLGIIGKTSLLFVLFTLFVSAHVFAQDSSYVVQRGDNLFRIAQRFGVTTDALAQANGITDPSHIFAGQQLTIPNFDTTAPVVENPLVGGTPTTHVVTGGESLQSIANSYGMTIEQVMQINNITNPDLIYRGQSLTVWDNGAILDPAAQPAAEVNVNAPIESAPVDAAAPVQPSETSYTVQPGEHLAQIARRFDVDWTNIAVANGLTDPNQIFAGQILTIPGSNVVSDFGIVSAPALPMVSAPPPTIYVGKQVVVDLSDQMVYAYDNGVLVRTVLVSTGLPGTPTVLGDYNVYVKYESQTMSGPGYYLPGVPWIMYFYQGYSLHGTYWHNNFGHPMSHGCVNMPTPEAEWFYNNFVDVGTAIHVQL